MRKSEREGNVCVARKRAFFIQKCKRWGETDGVSCAGCADAIFFHLILRKSTPHAENWGINQMKCDEYGFVLKVVKFTLALTQFHILLEMFNTVYTDTHFNNEKTGTLADQKSSKKKRHQRPNRERERVNAKPFAPRRKPNLLFPKTTMNGIIIFPYYVYLYVNCDFCSMGHSQQHWLRKVFQLSTAAASV